MTPCSEAWNLYIFLLRTSPPEHSRVSGVGTPERLWGSALDEVSEVGHSRSLWGWALQGDSGVGHSRVSASGSLALQANSAIGHSRETVGLGSPGSREFVGLSTPGSLCNWALQGVSGSRPGEEKSSGRGEELSLKSNTPKVGNKL